MYDASRPGGERLVEEKHTKTCCAVAEDGVICNLAHLRCRFDSRLAVPCG